MRFKKWNFTENIVRIVLMRLSEWKRQLKVLNQNLRNEWHYPSKGEYPEEREDVLCYCKVIGVKFYNVGHTIIGGDNKIRWWSSNRIEELKVYAWKEITLPK